MSTAWSKSERTARIGMPSVAVRRPGTAAETTSDAGARRDSPTERELVERAKLGDTAAFGQLYQRYIDDVFAYVQLRVRDEALAEDLTHDIWLGVLRGLSGFEWRGTFAPFLMRCAHNRVVKHWRTNGSRPQSESIPGDDDADDPRPELSDSVDPEAEAETRISFERIETALPQLTELQQQVIALRFGAGLNVAETAEVMSRTPNAVKNLQHNALAALRRQIVTEVGA